MVSLAESFGLSDCRSAIPGLSTLSSQNSRPSKASWAQGLNPTGGSSAVGPIQLWMAPPTLLDYDHPWTTTRGNLPAQRQNTFNLVETRLSVEPVSK